MTPDLYIAFVVTAALLIVFPGSLYKSETYSHPKPHYRRAFGGYRGGAGGHQE